jgi:hypothetical protein
MRNFFNEDDFENMEPSKKLEIFIKMLNEHFLRNKPFNGFINTNHPFMNLYDDYSFYDIMKSINNENLNIESGFDNNGEWESKTWVSPDGSVSFSSFSRSSGPEDFSNVEFDDFGSSSKRQSRKNFDDETIKKLKIEKLEKRLKDCVEKEEYEKASEIKKMIDELKK